MICGLAVALIGACTNDSPTAPVGAVAPSAAVISADDVTDLAVTAATDSTVTLTWTQVNNGEGQPASYRLKYAPPAINWSTATIGCDRTIAGTQIGAPMSCTVAGLPRATTYDFQLMSFRLSSTGTWLGAVYSNVATGRTTTPDAKPVSDLAVASVTESTLTVRWTQVDDGSGHPASYSVRQARPQISWSSATPACAATIAGTQIGATMSCTIQGLAASTTYDVQVESYRLVSGGTDGEAYSNVATGQTAAPPALPAPSGSGIWISKAEVMALPMSGTAWNNVLSAANSSCGAVDLADQEDATNVCIMAKALVFARTGTASYRSDVVGAITQVVNSGVYLGRALALGRELGAYVIAADLIDLKSYNSTLDAAFRTTLRVLLIAPTTEAGTLQECHERRPNNWGTHCGGSRAAIAAYLGDTTELNRVAQVFRGWLGNRSSYAGFSYGDTSWQCDPTRPVGINPAGCTKSGRNIDGVLPDDQRRAGSFTWPAPRENYVWEALQGALMQAVILHRAGYPVWDWENRALLRAVTWLYNVNGYPAEGDDTWQPHLVNRYYGTSLAAPTPSRPGKNVGWTDWTHR